MDRSAEEILGEAAAASQARQNRRKVAGKRIALLLFLAFVLGGIAVTWDLFRNLDNDKLALVAIAVIAYAALVAGVTWLHRRFYPQNQRVKVVTFAIDIILFVALTQVIISILHNAAP